MILDVEAAMGHVHFISPPFFVGNDCKPRNPRPRGQVDKNHEEEAVILDKVRQVFMLSRLFPVPSAAVSFLCPHPPVPPLPFPYFLLPSFWARKGSLHFPAGIS